MEQTTLLEQKVDAARLLGISLRKLDYLIAEKKLKTVRIGKRRLVPRKVLEDFIRKETK